MGRGTTMVDKEMKAQVTIKKSICGDNNQHYSICKNRIEQLTLNQFPTEWKDYMNHKFEDQSNLLKSLSDEIKQLVRSAVLSKMENIAAEITKEKCLSNDETIKAVEEIGVSLDELETRGSEIFDDIRKILQDQKTTDGCVSELQTLNERLQWDTSKTLDCCHEIFTQIQSGNKLIDEIGKENSTAIKGLKEILINYIKLAEKRHEEYQTAIALQDKKYEALSSLSPGLDARTILEMRNWFQEMSKKDKKEIKESIDGKKGKLSEELSGIEENLTGIKELIKGYGQVQYESAKEILQRLEKSWDLELDTNEKVTMLVQEQKKRDEEIKKRDEEIKKRDERIESLKASGVDNESSQTEIKKLSSQLEELSSEREKLSSERNTLLETIAILQNNGNQRLKKECCPFCLVEEERPVVGTQCECLVCGHIFTTNAPIDPNMFGIPDEKLQEDVQLIEPEPRNKNNREVEIWRSNHTAKLEKVSGGENLYRMQVPSYVGDSDNDKILIIPSVAEWPKPETEVRSIDFCQPNTDDKEGWERLSKVKKLFLKGNIKIGKFDDKVPFSEITGLEKVMTWNGESFKEDNELLERIKRNKVV